MITDRCQVDPAEDRSGREPAERSARDAGPAAAPLFAGPVTSPPDLLDRQQVAHLQRLAGNKAVAGRLAGPVGTPVQRVGAAITSPPRAGTSIHPVLSRTRPVNDKTATTELQQKLGSVLGPMARLALNVEQGRFGSATEKYLKEYQKTKGLGETGVADADTWAKLDVDGKSTVGRVERDWKQELDYGETGMTSKYSWEIETGQVRNRVVVRVGIKFVADPASPPPNLSAKVAKIKNMVLKTWNRFQAVRTDATAPSRPIVFEIVDSGGTTVNVVNGDGVSDADHWFWGDVITLPNVPAHEFGHLIGLEDEYQRPEAAYKRLFPDRSDQEVQADKTQSRVPNTDVYTSKTSLMGLGSIDTHPDKVNPPEPRHVREFVKYLERAVGGTWEARAR